MQPCLEKYPDHPGKKSEILSSLWDRVIVTTLTWSRPAPLSTTETFRRRSADPLLQALAQQSRSSASVSTISAQFCNSTPHSEGYHIRSSVQN